MFLQFAQPAVVAYGFEEELYCYVEAYHQHGNQQAVNHSPVLRSHKHSPSFGPQVEGGRFRLLTGIESLPGDKGRVVASKDASHHNRLKGEEHKAYQDEECVEPGSPAHQEVWRQQIVVDQEEYKERQREPPHPRGELPAPFALVAQPQRRPGKDYQPYDEVNEVLKYELLFHHLSFLLVGLKIEIKAPAEKQNQRTALFHQRNGI
jgi:hypothetical protein